jgi:hypothetical protein
MVSDKELKAARQRTREMRKNVPHAVAATYLPKIKRILVTLSDGFEIALDPERIQTLEHAKPSALKKIEINAAGYELFFPALDDGIWVPGLLEGLLGTRKWMREIAKRDTEEYLSRKRQPSSQLQSSRTAA